jgi:hypothetical protein
MKFLETITALGNDVLVPVSQIKIIWITYGQNGWEIHIKGQDNNEWIECFEKDEKKLNVRWTMIKYILGVPDEKDVINAMNKLGGKDAEKTAAKGIRE